MKVRLVPMILAALVVLLFSAAPAYASGQSPVANDVTDAIANAGPDDQIPVMILAPGHVDDVRAALTAEATTEAVPLVDAVSTELTADQIQQLAESPVAQDITDIQTDDSIVGLGWSDTLSFTNLAIGLGDVKPPTQGGPSGAGVNVAVLDTGVAAQPDLAGYPIVAFKDFVNGQSAPYDDAGHGTFVAGLIAGSGASSIPVDQGGQAIRQYRGVAPRAGIVALKVLDGQGQGRESDVIRAIAWAIQNRVRYNIDVLNISLGAPVASPTAFDPMAYAVEAAWKAGITVVSAAGNDGDFGPGGILSPGNDPYVITVGASNTQQTASTADDTICSYSSVGPTLFDEYAKPDVVAPGNRNISLRVAGSYVDTTWPENEIPVSQYIPGAPASAVPVYYMLSGTSTSTPVVSGIVADMLSADSSLTPDDIKLRLMATAKPLPDTSDLQQGTGVVNAAEALRSSLQAHGPTLSKDLGNGTTVLTPDRYRQFGYYAWDKFKWAKFKWDNFTWAKFKWARSDWADYDWTKFKWAKFKWADVDWTKFKWATFQWNGTEWQKFKWATVDWLKFKWATYDWLKFKWATLIEGE